MKTYDIPELIFDEMFPNDRFGPRENLNIENGVYFSQKKEDNNYCGIYNKLFIQNGFLEKMESYGATSDNIPYITWYFEYSEDGNKMYREFTQDGTSKELFTGITKESREKYNNMLKTILNDSMQLNDKVDSVSNCAKCDSRIVTCTDGRNIYYCDC